MSQESAELGAIANSLENIERILESISETLISMNTPKIEKEY